MKGILLSLGILIPTILPSQIPLVPFPGIFSTYIGAHLSKRQFCFRPLSRGPFFNWQTQKSKKETESCCFRPLSRGPFFNKTTQKLKCHKRLMVFVPFLGDLFSMKQTWMQEKELSQVFVPYLGDFLSIRCYYGKIDGIHCFRPLSWGLSFNGIQKRFAGLTLQSFRPLSWGLSFNVKFDGIAPFIYGFRPLSWGLSFNSVPAKPQPVCSRKRIRGGDGGIASSGTLLRR